MHEEKRCKKKKGRNDKLRKQRRLSNKSREEESFLGKYIIHFDRGK